MNNNDWRQVTIGIIVAAIILVIVCVMLAAMPVVMDYLEFLDYLKIQGK